MTSISEKSERRRCDDHEKCEKPPQGACASLAGLRGAFAAVFANYAPHAPERERKPSSRRGKQGRADEERDHGYESGDLKYHVLRDILYHTSLLPDVPFDL